MSLSFVQVPTIPNVAVVVRHSKACPHAGDEFYRSCRCPKHLRSSFKGKLYRQSARTRAWSIAEERRREVVTCPLIPHG